MHVLGGRWAGTMLLAAVLGAVLPAPPAPALQGQAPPSEYDVKARMLLSIPTYVEWPPSAFEGARKTFRVGHVGKDVFNGKLDQVAKEAKVNERAVEVVSFASADDVQACHVLFVSELERSNLGRIAEALKGSATLIVSEVPGGARGGAVLNYFIKPDKRVGLQANPDAAGRQNIVLSSKLLRLAEIVRD